MYRQQRSVWLQLTQPSANATCWRAHSCLLVQQTTKPSTQSESLILVVFLLCWLNFDNANTNSTSNLRRVTRPDLYMFAYCIVLFQCCVTRCVAVSNSRGAGTKESCKYRHSGLVCHGFGEGEKHARLWVTASLGTLWHAEGGWHIPDKCPHEKRWHWHVQLSHQAAASFHWHQSTLHSWPSTSLIFWFLYVAILWVKYVLF